MAIKTKYFRRYLLPIVDAANSNKIELKNSNKLIRLYLQGYNFITWEGKRYQIGELSSEDFSIGNQAVSENLSQ